MRLILALLWGGFMGTVGFFLLFAKTHNALMALVLTIAILYWGSRVIDFGRAPRMRKWKKGVAREPSYATLIANWEREQKASARDQKRAGASSREGKFLLGDDESDLLLDEADDLFEDDWDFDRE